MTIARENSESHYVEMTLLKLASKERPAWFFAEVPTTHMEMKKPRIKWSRIKSLSIEGLTVRVMYSGRKQITYSFDTEAEMLEILDDRSEVDQNEADLASRKHLYFRDPGESRQQRAAG